MGCSPSKGNNFGTLGPLRKGRMLPPSPQESPRESHSVDRENPNFTGTTDGDSKERKTQTQYQVHQRDLPVTPQKKKSVPEPAPESVSKLTSQRTDNSRMSEKNREKQDEPDKKSGKKTKKNSRGTKVLKKKDKDREKLSTVPKVDFPEPLVKAHQAAYAFLNPSINKYDVALGLLEQATQTQASVQPMVTFMALRYEEIIQILEEMAEEGEMVLKENGEHLAWPSQMKNLPSSPPLLLDSANFEHPPDLLQQLLQYTTQRMRNVSQSVGGISDSALEEAVEYFASVSELLEEKLKVKRVVETRLMQLLSRIEMASVRKPGPEDSALFSEDSGIGGENESLVGSESRLRRESCESARTSSTTPIGPIGYNSMYRASSQKLTYQLSPSVSLTSLNSLSSICTLMATEPRDSLLGSVSFADGEEDDEDNDKMDKGLRKGRSQFRKGLDSSPLSHKQQQPQRLPTKRIENPKNVEMTIKMKNAISGRIQFVQSSKLTDSPKNNRGPLNKEKERPLRRSQTVAPTRRGIVKTPPAAKERRSRSTESLRSRGDDPTLLELERTQKNLNQRLQRMNKNKATGSTRTDPAKQNQVTSPAQSPTTNHKSLETRRNPQIPKGKAGVKKCKKQELTSNVEVATKPTDETTLRGPTKATPPPSPPQSPRPASGFYRGRNSVRKLIDTFSQGIEELDSPKVLGPLKGVRKCGVPVLPGLGNVEAVLSAGKTSCRPEYTASGDLDFDSLPPPPLEVLLDNSFESAQCLSTAGADDRGVRMGRSSVVKRTVLSQRLRASVQSVPVLPSKGGLPLCSKVSITKADQSSIQSKMSLQGIQAETEPKEDSHSFLSQQARENSYQRQSSVTQSENSSSSQTVSQEDSTEFQSDLSVPGLSTMLSTVPPSSVDSSHPPKGRRLPSTPSTPNIQRRRLPSPQSFRRQPTPPSSASPPVYRKLATTPEAQRRLPSPPVVKKNINPNGSSSYPFKAPSPPASPKVRSWSRENSTEDSAPLINNARSVFCPASSSMFEAQPGLIHQTSQAWTSTGVSFLSRSSGNRGKLSVSVQGPQPYIRRSHSDRRPSLSLPPQTPGISVAETCGSEPTVNTQGLDDDPLREDYLWGHHSDLRAPMRSASHPDLCVIGQGLNRD